MTKFILSNGTMMVAPETLLVLLSMSEAVALRAADHRGAMIRLPSSVIVARFADSLARGERVFVKRGADLVSVVGVIS